MQTDFFVDGYNLFYGALSDTPYKWLDLRSLLTSIAKIENPSSVASSVNYFSAPVQPKLASRGTVSKEAQDSYIRALKSSHCSVVMGRHTLSEGYAPIYEPGRDPDRSHRTKVWKIEEKETDVNIALEMYRCAARSSGEPRQIVLVSGDTDMGPALEAIKSDFPNIRRGVILPHREGHHRTVPGSLKSNSDWIRKVIRDAELEAHQFPDRVPTGKKPAIKPSYW